MDRIIYSRKNGHEALETLLRKRFIATDKDGVLLDPSELMHEDRVRGFAHYGLEFPYSVEVNYRLGGVSDKYNGGRKPLIALIAFEKMIKETGGNGMSRNDRLSMLIGRHDAEKQLDLLVKKYISEDDVQLANKIYSWDNGTFFGSEEAIKYMKAYPGSKEALMELADLYDGNVVILTNTNMLDWVMRDLRVAGFNSQELSSITIVANAKKPSPVTLQQAMWRMGVESSEAVYVGDAAVDIMTAKNAQVTSVGVLSGMAKLETLRKVGADIIVEDLASLTTILRNDFSQKV